MIEVLTGSTLNTIQDFGRPRAMTLAVARGGAMDRLALAQGNFLLGNAPGDAGIEVVFFPFRIRFDAPTALALTGAEGPATLDGRVLPANWAITAQPGQVLTVQAPSSGSRRYLTFGGGLDVPVVLGARATDVKGNFGGFHGRPLQKGDILATLPVSAADIRFPEYGYGLSHPAPLPGGTETVVRVLPAAEHHLFTPESLRIFEDSTWTLTSSANRMGYRLEGDTPMALHHRVSLFSHGIMPGTVQVPPAGQPIIQMMDANTCGGYPKIATVIEPDLRLLGQTPVGRAVRFVTVSRDEAVTAIRREATELAALERDLRTLRAGLLCA
ncbi:5-oxoprolinase subunit C family protein [Gluconobacter thailandicus]|uniref:Biotin-dependent carboxyltransferase n=1 Tax=Gluconobacter thailandicus TaxID=257438 RepID=A0AAP9ET15_GLUTH|nr:biotin-dependent carboxyltransferase family protein [Gluconobacter thailandicus]QEH96958.1 biotin-dependent carboxyltransferase [Gluconobacter thailandicus]